MDIVWIHFLSFLFGQYKPEPSQLIKSYLTLFILCQTCFNASQVQIKLTATGAAFPLLTCCWMK